MMDFPHLDPSVIPILGKSLEERITFTNTDKWIKYRRALEILSALENLYAYPRSLRMPCMAIVGRSGNGKSSILEAFTKAHPFSKSEDGLPVRSILSIRLPATPDMKGLFGLILRAMNYEPSERARVDFVIHQVEHLMGLMQVKMLIIDEFNHFVNAGKRAADLITSLKALSSSARISIVASGTHEALNALNTEPQMKLRFEPYALDTWKLDLDYLRFLKTIEQLLPLEEPSDLASEQLAPVIYEKAGESIGSTVKLLQRATVKSLQTKRKKIDLATIEGLEWVKFQDWSQVIERAG